MRNGPSVSFKGRPDRLMINVFSHWVVIAQMYGFKPRYSPNFSNRRYSACRDRPNSRATSVMLPRYLCIAC